MVDDKVIITKQGLADVKKELEDRKTKMRDKLADDIAQAREQGDLSENAAYSAALEAKQFNEARIEELESIIKNSIVKAANKKDTYAGLGENITIVRLSDNKEVTYMLVGENESNPLEGKISIKSPIGKSLVGKKVGDKLVVELPAGKVEFQIKKIN